MLRKQREKGQVLLIGVIAVIILLVAIYLLFDVQMSVSKKMKTQNAVDSAALVGARWQMHTLNTIGEINLIKASTVLLSEELFLKDMKNVSEFMQVTEKEEFDNIDLLQRYGILKASAAALSQMQYRLLFIGPLIGVGAAQQAALNNGLGDNSSYGSAVSAQLSALNGTDEMPEYLSEAYDGKIPENLSWSGIYDSYKKNSFVQSKLYGFKWYIAYTSLLNDLIYQGNDGAHGFAVMPSGDILGRPQVTSNSTPDVSSFLSSKSFFEAVDANYWCWLKDFLDLSFESSNTKWWGNLTVSMSNSFSGESEYLPIKVCIREAQGSVLNLQLIQSGFFDESAERTEKKTHLIEYRKFCHQRFGRPFCSEKRRAYSEPQRYR